MLLKILQVFGLAGSAIIALLAFFHAVSKGGKKWIEAMVQALLEKVPRWTRMLLAAVVLFGIVAVAVNVVFAPEKRIAKGTASDGGLLLAENILIAIKNDLTAKDISNQYGLEMNATVPKLQPSRELSVAFRSIGVGDSLIAWSNLAVQIKKSSISMRGD